MNDHWHAIPLSEVFARIDSSETGLSETEVTTRLAAFGRNELPTKKEHSALMLLVSQFDSPLMLIMIAATVVSLFLGNAVEGIFIFVVMVSNALVGFYQEHKANQSLKALQDVIRLQARVVRDTKEREIDAGDIVPGDVIVLRAGDKVPADARIVQCKSLKINEASLTGESKPVSKSIVLAPENAEIADRTNMVFMGTIVEEGSATAVVTETGARTEYGDIVTLLEETPEETTPLQRMVASLSRFIGVFITLVVGLIVAQGYFAGHDLPLIFETSLALFVSAIPEGLLPGITIVLVLGMRRILQRKGLVRRLAATETLGDVGVICTDKTGTLTEGKMQVVSILTAAGPYVLESHPFHELSAATHMSVKAAVLATDAYLENPGAPFDQIIVRGNLTEQALLRMGVRCGVNPYEANQDEPALGTLLFTSERKYSASLRDTRTDTARLYVVGAPEVILAHTSAWLTPEGEKKATGHEYTHFIAEKDILVAQGFRVVACAYRPIESSTLSPNHDIDVESLASEKLILAGFIAISDPVRADVPAAFEKTRNAGIRTVIVTGDHVITARLVAEKIGLTIADDAILEGHQIEALSDESLAEKIKTVSLYARVSPRHKLRIVHAFQKSGVVVAMLGDGINDAPALKAADIGVAVDTRVSAAREVADIVLLDGGFSTIVTAIEQGRIIFQNIRKVFLYLITQDFSQFFLFMVAVFIGLPLPVLAVQLLLVNLVESGLPDLALTTEQEKEGLMTEPPRDPKESVLNRASWHWMISLFVVNGGIALLFFNTLLHTVELDKARTMMTIFLCMESLFLVFAVRSFHRSVFRADIFSNRILTGAVILSLCMVLAAAYIPTLQSMLSLVPLSPSDWFFILLVNTCELVILDMLKLMFFKKNRHGMLAMIGLRPL